jgi:hypothetical protein
MSSLANDKNKTSFLYFSASIFKPGISARQGAHPMYQKLIPTLSLITTKMVSYLLQGLPNQKMDE